MQQEFLLISIISIISILVYFFFFHPSSKPNDSQSTKLKSKLNIAIIGMGAIGTSVAFEFLRTGHKVTGVARGKRLEQLKQQNSIITTKLQSKQELNHLTQSLDLSISYDLIIVTVLAHQVDELLPQLRNSKAKNILFLFNIMRIEKLLNAVGKERFGLGLVTIQSSLDQNGKLDHLIPKQETTVNDQKFVEFLKQANIPANSTPDIESWMRTRIVFARPLLISACLIHANFGKISWNELTILSGAMFEGFNALEKLGTPITPTSMKWIQKMPSFLISFLLYFVGKHLSSLVNSGTGPEAYQLYQDLQMEYKSIGNLPFISEAMKMLIRIGKQQ